MRLAGRPPGRSASASRRCYPSRFVLGEPFFWAGLGAVAGFFAAAALLAMGFFTADRRARARLTVAQAAVAALVLGATAACAWLLRGRLAAWGADPPPEQATAVVAAMRETISLMLLGLASVVNALLGAFAWIRAGRAGAAFRTLVWAFPAVRLVTACSAALDHFGGLRAAPGAPPPAEVAAAWRELAGAADRGLALAAGIAAALALLSWPAGAALARASRRAAAAPPE